MIIAKWLSNIIVLGIATILSVLILFEITGYQDILREVSPSLAYYAILAALLILLLASLGLREKYKINVVLSLGSIMLVLYGLELVLIMRSSTPIRTAEENNISFDKRTKLEVIDQFARDGIEAFPDIVLFDIVDKGYLDIDDEKVLPLSGVSDRLIVACNETGEYLIYQSDEHGFHNPKGLHSGKDLTIAAVGDSFTRGSCVKSEQNAIAVIRNTYPNTLNLGRGGNGPLTMLATLKEYAEPLKPKIVLWIYFAGNDLYDLGREKRADLLRRYLDTDYSQNLRTMQPEIDAELIKFLDDARVKAETYENLHPGLKFLLFDHLRSRIDRALVVMKRNSFTDYDLFREVLASAKDLTSSWGGELYFVYFPGISYFDNPEAEKPVRVRVMRLVDDLDIPIIDLTDAFAAHPDPRSLRPFRGYGHFNEAGYRLFGEAILQYIEENDILPPSEKE